MLGYAILACAAIALGLRARWGLGATLLSAALACLGAAGLRWAIVATMSPAYPEHAARFAGPEVWGAVVALGLVWLWRDHRLAPRGRG